MAKYISGRQKNLKVGISSYSENLTSLEVIGKVGIGTTNAQSNLYVVGDGKFTGVVTAAYFYGDGSGLTGITSTSIGINIVGVALSVSGISTLGRVQISTGIITATTGVVTYYGDGSKLTGINASAGIATYAPNAGVATYSDSAGIATYAPNAGVATYSDSAGIATYADSAGIATYADSAGIATYATSSGIATYADSAGIATALQYQRTFQITGDIVGSPISFDGTGNVSIAATIQPDSVALGSDTTGDYVQSITGTSNQISVSVTSGEGSTPVISIPNQFTIPQDATVIRDLQVNRNLNVTGNITLGGTTAFLNVQELKIADSDIVLGFRTDAFGNDVSNDTTANHGGVAVASTEGNPLVNLNIAGIETSPVTYKKIMWFKSGAFAGLGTDAWLFNYGVGIGSTQVPNGVRLAVGAVQFTERDLISVGNINASGIITATTFVGVFSGNASSATYAPNAGVATYSPNAGVATYASEAGIATYAPNAGVATYASEAGIATYAPNAGIATYASEAGIATYAPNAGVATYAPNAGVATYAPNAGVSTYATSAGIATYAPNTGTSTSVIGGIASVTQLSVSGFSTVGVLTATNIGIGTTNPTSALWIGGDGYFVGVVSASNFYVGGNVIGGGNVSGASIAGAALSISGISTLGTVQISSGIVTATSGVVTYYGDGSRLTGIQTAGAGVAAGGTFTQIQFNDSGTLNGANFFNYDKGTARVGIGTSSPTARLSVASSITGASLMVVNDNLSDGSLFRVNDNSGIVLLDVDANGTILFPTTGNVGIGTTLISPTSKLQVVGNVLVSGIVTATNFSGIFTGSYFGDGSKLSGILTSGSAGGSTGQVQFNVDGTPTGANFFNYDTETARVGIGTSIPTARLSVASTTTGTSLMVVNDNLSDGSLFRVTDNSANILMDVDANGTIVFNNSGNIGIGTTIVTPTSKLQVTGDALVSGVVTATTFSGNLSGIALTVTTGIIDNIVGVAATISTVKISSGIITATSGVVTYYGSGAFLTGIVTSGAAGQGAAGQIQFNDSGPLAGSGFFHYDKGTARVGIGTSIPTARLSVASTTTGTSLMVVNDNLSDGSLFRVTDNSANILMDVDANGIIVFNNSGNIGIGTTMVTPTSKFQVTGDALVSGVVTATTFSGNLSGIALTVTTGIITNITSVNGNISGVTTTQRLNVGTGGTIFTTTDAGLVGIGTSVPGARLSVSSPTSGNSLMVVNDNLTDGSLFRVNDNSANVLMDVDANGTILFPTTGNIGIGTTLFTPTSKLQVVGNVLISGIVTAGTLQISSGIVTATSGVVTYYGDGSKLTGINASAGIATYAPNAGVATYASEAGIATYATSAGIATYATNSGIATYATSAGIATYATNSGIATYATSAGIATYATSAGIATYATSAGISTYATNAGIATYATNSGIATYANNAGVSTALQYQRTFEITGDIVASPISFDGTGNVSLAATIQPNSVGLGTDTFGDYVKDITGTANEITVTGGTGEGSSPTLSIPNQFTAPQDVTVTRDLQVIRNLNVNGNITIGGTSAVIFSQSLNIFDPDIVLGYRTDSFGNDTSNDNTANHGGVALASTEGTPLVQLFIAGIETNPATYKKFMWFKAGSFAGLGTDAWLSNYAIGIGSTQFPVGTRLAAGSVQFTENDLAVVRNINASGIITATEFKGTLTGNTSSATYATSAGIATYATNSGIATYATSAGIATYATNSGIATYAPNAGVATYAPNAGVATYAPNAGVSTYATSAGIATYAPNAGVATYAPNAGVATYAPNTGTSTSVIGGIASVTQLSVSGFSTLGRVQISTGIITATTGVVTYYGDGSKLTGINASAGIATYADNAGIATYADNAGIATLSQGLTGTPNIDVGILTATSYNGSGTNLTGIVTSIVAGTNITVSGSTGQVTINSTATGGGGGSTASIDLLEVMLFS